MQEREKSINNVVVVVVNDDDDDEKRFGSVDEIFTSADLIKSDLTSNTNKQLIVSERRVK